MTVEQLKKIKIRRAVKQDLSTLLPLMVKYMNDFYESPRNDEKMLKHILNEIYNDPTKGLQFVAEKDNKIIGFATLYFTNNAADVKKIAVLHDLFVIPECRKEKVEQTLFKTCLTFIRENDFLYMVWETAQGNQKFYK
ncbi:GNAT family N-acetyltransferase [Neobacillus cucumis]|uniref:GNAT family N-acetyltransferase n=1 Tax=Neobacillus cucumis TaxID=1740721 RepID=UPI0018E05D2F|nr:GNAT family N-acetyltransferase [Neobacillus cucumis]MBI0580545.1 GNAT family N-acetyltransferase [Neobacillus cucumis]